MYCPTSQCYTPVLVILRITVLHLMKKSYSINFLNYYELVFILRPITPNCCDLQLLRLEAVLLAILSPKVVATFRGRSNALLVDVWIFFYTKLLCYGFATYRTTRI